MRETVVSCLPHYVPSDEVIDFLLWKMKDRTWKTRGRQWRDIQHSPDNMTPSRIHQNPFRYSTDFVVSTPLEWAQSKADQSWIQHTTYIREPFSVTLLGTTRPNHKRLPPSVLATVTTLSFSESVPNAQTQHHQQDISEERTEFIPQETS